MKQLLLFIAIIVINNSIKAQNYDPSSGDYYSDEYITNVQIGSINNTSANPSGYSDYTTQTAVLLPGSTYNLSVTINAYYGGGDYIKAWIDWNDDGDFADAGESYEIVANTSSDGPHSVNITVPDTTVVINTRLRVSLKWNSYPSSTGPFAYGEVEDYSIYVDKDSDGDGVYDISDLDDDNDGMLDDDENICLSQDF